MNTREISKLLNEDYHVVEEFLSATSKDDAIRTTLIKEGLTIEEADILSEEASDKNLRIACRIQCDRLIEEKLNEGVDHFIWAQSYLEKAYSQVTQERCQQQLDELIIEGGLFLDDKRLFSKESQLTLELTVSDENLQKFYDARDTQILNLADGKRRFTNQEFFFLYGLAKSPEAHAFMLKNIKRIIDRALNEYLKPHNTVLLEIKDTIDKDDTELLSYLTTVVEKFITAKLTYVKPARRLKPLVRIVVCSHDDVTESPVVVRLVQKKKSEVFDYRHQLLDLAQECNCSAETIEHCKEFIDREFLQKLRHGEFVADKFFAQREHLKSKRAKRHCVARLNLSINRELRTENPSEQRLEKLYGYATMDGVKKKIIRQLATIESA